MKPFLVPQVLVNEGVYFGVVRQQMFSVTLLTLTGKKVPLCLRAASSMDDLAQVRRPKARSCLQTRPAVIDFGYCRVLWGLCRQWKTTKGPFEICSELKADRLQSLRPDGRFSSTAVAITSASAKSILWQGYAAVDGTG